MRYGQRFIENRRRLLETTGSCGKKITANHHAGEGEMTMSKWQESKVDCRICAGSMLCAHHEETYKMVERFRKRKGYE